MIYNSFMTHSIVNWRWLSTVFVLFIVFIAILLPIPISAQGNPPEQKFIPLVQIPGITDREANIEDYINGLYTLSITAAALLVVVKLIGAGAGYVMSDVVTSKEQSKKDIRNAIIGLLIILASVTILTEINPNLRRLDFLSGVEGLDFSGDNRTSKAYEMKTGDKIVSCKDKDSQSCQKDICEPKGGEVTTDGVRYVDGRVRYDDGRSLCIIGAKGDSGSMPGDIKLPGGITVNENIEYTDEKVNEIIKSQVEAENYIDHTSVNNITKEQEIRNCTEVNNGTPQIINRKPPSEDMLLCLKKTNNNADSSENTAGPDDIDLKGTYTINDPAVPSQGLSEGPNHGKTVKLLKPTRTGYSVEFEDGLQSVHVGCALFEPKPPGC